MSSLSPPAKLGSHAQIYTSVFVSARRTLRRTSLQHNHSPIAFSLGEVAACEASTMEGATLNPSTSPLPALVGTGGTLCGTHTGFCGARPCTVACSTVETNIPLKLSNLSQRQHSLTQVNCGLPSFCEADDTVFPPLLHPLLDVWVHGFHSKEKLVYDCN